MPLTQGTKPNGLTLEVVLHRLAQNEQVDGLALFGSRSEGVAQPASDYDLLILISSLPVGIFQLLTHIGGVMADVVFVLTDQVERLLSSGEPVAANTHDGRFLWKMQTAQIIYDASGRLTRAQELAQGAMWLEPASYASRYG